MDKFVRRLSKDSRITDRRTASTASAAAVPDQSGDDDSNTNIVNASNKSVTATDIADVVQNTTEKRKLAEEPLKTVPRIVD